MVDKLTQLNFFRIIQTHPIVCFNSCETQSKLAEQEQCYFPSRNVKNSKVHKPIDPPS